MGTDVIIACPTCGGKTGDDPDVPGRIAHKAPCVRPIQMVKMACFDPGRYVKRDKTEDPCGDDECKEKHYSYEHLDDWRARAVLVALERVGYQIVVKK